MRVSIRNNDALHHILNLHSSPWCPHRCFASETSSPTFAKMGAQLGQAAAGRTGHASRRLRQPLPIGSSCSTCAAHHRPGVLPADKKPDTPDWGPTTSAGPGHPHRPTGWLLVCVHTVIRPRPLRQVRGGCSGRDRVNAMVSACRHVEARGAHSETRRYPLLDVDAG
jgi:hypothetical protein